MMWKPGSTLDEVVLDRPAEEARLRALESYALAGGAPEPQLTRLLATTALALRAPAAALLLVDRDREIVFAAAGLEHPGGPREGSFAAAVLERSGLLIDSGPSPRFRPVRVGELEARFHAGVPVLTPGGAAIGALAVFDVTPRALSPEEAQMLDELAHHAACVLESRRAGLVRDSITSAMDRDLSEGIARLRVLAAAGLRAPAASLEGQRVVLLLEELERLDSLVEAVRELTAVALGQAPPSKRERVDLRSLCEELIAELAAGAGVRFQFEVDGDCSGSWDAARLSRAAALIFEEAYERAGRDDALVRVRAACPQPDLVVVTLTLPAGPETPPAVRVQLARELILQQGGEIDYRREAQRSVFTIRLPRRPPP